MQQEASPKATPQFSQNTLHMIIYLEKLVRFLRILFYKPWFGINCGKYVTSCVKPSWTKSDLQMTRKWSKKSWFIKVILKPSWLLVQPGFTHQVTYLSRSISNHSSFGKHHNRFKINILTECVLCENRRDFPRTRTSLYWQKLGHSAHDWSVRRTHVFSGPSRSYKQVYVRNNGLFRSSEIAAAPFRCTLTRHLA